MCLKPVTNIITKCITCSRNVFIHKQNHIIYKHLNNKDICVIHWDFAFIFLACKKKEKKNSSPKNAYNSKITSEILKYFALIVAVLMEIAPAYCTPLWKCGHGADRNLQ